MKTPVHDFGPTQPRLRPRRSGATERVSVETPPAVCPGPAPGPRSLGRPAARCEAGRSWAGRAPRGLQGPRAGGALGRLPRVPPLAPRLRSPAPRAPPPIRDLPRHAPTWCPSKGSSRPSTGLAVLSSPQRSAPERDFWLIPYKHANEKHPRPDPIGLHLPALVARFVGGPALEW